MNEGYIKLNRKLLDWRYGNNMPMMGFWIYLLLKANWKDQERSHGVVRRGEFTSSVRQIACECGLSESTVKRYLNSLRKTGEICTSTNRQWTKITISKYEKYQSNEPTDEPTIELTVEPTIEPTAEPHLKKERKKEGKNTINTLLEKRANDVDQEAWFDAFWKVYPRKVGKQKARNRFKKIVTGEDKFKELMTAIEKQNEVYSTREMKSIPHPDTWLNQGRWEDELLPDTERPDVPMDEDILRIFGKG